MESRDVEQLNIDLLWVFGWQVQTAKQDESFGVSGKYLRLYRVTRPGHLTARNLKSAQCP